MSGDPSRRPEGVPSLFKFAMEAGVPPEDLLRAVGLDPAALARSGAGTPRNMQVRLIEAAARLSGDPDFGLHLAEWLCRCPEEHFTVLAYAVRSCATLGDHYRLMERYARLMDQGMYLRLVVEGEEARLVYGMRDDALAPRQAVECNLAMAVLQARRAVGPDVTPREVRFTHLPPVRTGEQERLFGAPLRYACARNELVLDRAYLDRSQHQPEPRLQALLERRLDAMLSRLPGGESFLGRVRRHLADQLMHGNPPVEAVATKLQMSSRSLQRRLKDEGTSTGKLLADLRRDMAMLHLQDPRKPIQEVAFLLGFAEVSAFHRAFKRWTGKTPAEYQRAART